MVSQPLWQVDEQFHTKRPFQNGVLLTKIPLTHRRIGVLA